MTQVKIFKKDPIQPDQTNIHRYKSCCGAPECDSQLALIIDYYKNMEELVRQFVLGECETCGKKIFINPEQADHYEKCNFDIIAKRSI